MGISNTPIGKGEEVGTEGVQAIPELCDKIADASAGYDREIDAVTVMYLELRRTTTSSEVVEIIGYVSMLSSSAETYKSNPVEFVAPIENASVETGL